MNNNILITITQYKAKKAKMKALEEEVKALQHDIEEYMGEETKIVVGQYTAKKTNCVRNSLDEKAIRAELPDIANKYNKTTEYTRLTVD
jgi:predicted phage-related endonuclease